MLAREILEGTLPAVVLADGLVARLVDSRNVHGAVLLLDVDNSTHPNVSNGNIIGTRAPLDGEEVGVDRRATARTESRSRSAGRGKRARQPSTTIIRTTRAGTVMSNPPA